MARAKILHDSLTRETFAGAVKLAAEARNITLGNLSTSLGLRPDSLRARLCVSRGKRAMQPHQVTKIAQALGIDETELHKLAAKHEGWKV